MDYLSFQERVTEGPNLQQQRAYLDGVNRLLQVGLKFDRSADPQHPWTIDPSAQVARVALSLNSGIFQDVCQAAHCAQPPKFDKKATNEGAFIQIGDINYQPISLFSPTNVTNVHFDRPSSSKKSKEDKDKGEMGSAMAVAFVIGGLVGLAASSYIGLRLLFAAGSDLRLKRELDAAAKELQAVEQIFNTSAAPHAGFDDDVKAVLRSYQGSIDGAREQLSWNVYAKSVGAMACLCLFASSAVGVHAGLQKSWDWGRLSIYSLAPTVVFWGSYYALKPGYDALDSELCHQLVRHRSNSRSHSSSDYSNGYSLFGKVTVGHKQFVEQVAQQEQWHQPQVFVWGYCPEPAFGSSFAPSAPPAINPEFVAEQYPGLGHRWPQPGQPLYPELHPNW